jgi:hypothetical protein
MRIHYIRCVAAILGLSCLLAMSGRAGTQLIEPGSRIGQVRIGEPLEQVHRALGKPEGEDAAMGGSFGK